jgi:hypothetical protein
VPADVLYVNAGIPDPWILRNGWDIDMGGAMRADSCYQGLMCEIHARHGANNVPRAELYPRWSAMGISIAGNKLPAGLAVPPNVGDAESGGGSAGFLRDYGACWLAVR